MKHSLKKGLILLCVTGFVLAWGAPAMAQTKPHAQLSSSGSNRGTYSSAVRSAIWAVEENEKCKRGCHDCWYELFPGMVNRCLGMRDWNNGAYQSGLKLLKLAASWGSKNAQYTLGLIYFNGHHVVANRPLGMAWLMLANERGNNPTMALVLRSTLSLATNQERDQARAMFDRLSETYGDQVAGARAWRRLRHKLNNHVGRLPPEVPNHCVDENGRTVPWEHGIRSNRYVLCMPGGQLAKSVTRISEKYFDGMMGTVTVGSLEQVPVPASSTP